MKRTIAIAALCAGIMLTTFPSQAKGSGNVKINSKNFPDTIVREYVSEKIDKNNDGYLSKKEISAVKTIIIDKNNLYWENKEKLKEKILEELIEQKLEGKSDSISMSREVFEQISRLTETVLSQQRTIESMQEQNKKFLAQQENVVRCAHVSGSDISTSDIKNQNINKGIR